MILQSPARLVSCVVIGSLLFVLATTSLVPIAGNDDEPSRGVVTRTDKEGAATTRSEIEIGSDEPNVKKEAGEESEDQSTPAGTPNTSKSTRKKSKTNKIEASDTSKSETSDLEKKPKTFSGNESVVGRGTEPNVKSTKTKKSGDAGAAPGMSAAEMMSGRAGSMSGRMPPGMGGPPGMSRAPGEMPRAVKLYAEGGHVILKQSEAGDVLWGYSETLGKWTRLAIPKGKDLLTPIVGDTVGVFWGKDRAYAYSTATGRWGELKTTGTPTVSFRKITIRDQDKVSVFSDASGRWSSTNDTDDEPPSEIEVNKFSDITKPNHSVDDTGRGVVFGDFDSDGRLDVVVSETSEKMKAADLLESLKARYQDSEREVIQAAAEYRKIRQRLGEKDSKTLELRAGLARLVKESFDHRQRAQKVEAEMLRRRLLRVDGRLSDRERLKNQIIQHRLEELQNTNVRWDAEADDQARSNDRGPPATSSPARSAPEDVICEFVPRGSASVTVGVVSNVSDDGLVEISQREIAGIRVGDELEVIRPEMRESDPIQPASRFARVFVVKAGPEIAIARMVESTRVLRNDKYGWDPILRGFTVGRPVEIDDEAETVDETRDISALEPLLGQWSCVGQNDNGRETPPKELRRLQRSLFIVGNRFRLADLADGTVFKGRRLAIDSDPGEVDFLNGENGLPDGDRRMGICHIDGQTLRICVGVQRPTEFKAGPDVLLMTFERMAASRQGASPGTPRDSGDDATLKESSEHFINRITVRELLADSIPLDFAMFDPKDKPVEAKVRHQHVVCLRGVVPWKDWQEQAAKLAGTIQNVGQRKSADTLDIRDFKIERQESVETLAVWSEIPWDAYTVSRSLEVLNSCEGFHPDMALEAERSAALTSPLPLLRRGAWDERVLHPRLAQGRLPGAPLRTGTSEAHAGANDSSGTARYVLFRFFDFDVNDGRSYRYRIKLVIEGSAQDELQEGPWSELSTVAVLEEA